MATFNKLGSLLRQSALASSVSAGSAPAMFNAARFMSSKLFVGGLSWGNKDGSMKEAFSSFGEVYEARVITDRETERSRGFGFVEFSSEEDAKKAASSMDGQVMESTETGHETLDIPSPAGWFRGSSTDREKLVTQTVEAFICFDNEVGEEQAAPKGPSNVKHSKLSAREEEATHKGPNKVKHLELSSGEEEAALQGPSNMKNSKLSTQNSSRKRARVGGPRTRVAKQAAPQGPSKVKHSTLSAETLSQKRTKGGGSQTRRGFCSSS